MMVVMALGVRRVVVMCLVVVAGLLGCVGTASASATVGPRIFGGAKVPIADHPWQAAILVKGVANAFQAQFCAGVVIDSRHVITAAHCLDAEGDFDELGDPIPDGVVDDPSERQVLVGAGDLGASPLPAAAQRVDIASWAPMPEYGQSASGLGIDDAALATLATPLNFSVPGVRPAVLVGPGELTAPGTRVQVSGWGTTAALPNGSRQLQATDLLTVSDPDCGSFYEGELDDATNLCAIAPGKDSCNGDSGGPLTAMDGTLLGLVSWGPLKCASPNGAPSGYTELAEPAIAAFIRNFSPDPAYNPPQLVSAPALSGTAKSGETLTCQPGSWTSVAAGAPEVEFGFRATDGTMLSPWSPSTTYTLTDADAGRQVACVERARDASGASEAASPAGAPVIGPPPAVVPAPPTQAPATKAIDTVAPRTSFASISCRARRCRVRVRTIDRGSPVSGVKNVRVTLLPVRGPSRTVTARRIANGLYEARFTRVARGNAWFTVATLDRAGNRSPQPSIKRARVR